MARPTVDQPDHDPTQDSRGRMRRALAPSSSNYPAGGWAGATLPVWDSDVLDPAWGKERRPRYEVDERAGGG
jgi:hypothetical protein